MTDTSIEDPHAEAGGHVGQGATIALAVARMAANLKRRNGTPPSPRQLVRDVAAGDPKAVDAMQRRYPQIGTAYREAIAAGADRQSAMLAAAERGEVIVAAQRGDGTFVVSDAHSVSAEHFDDTIGERRRLVEGDRLSDLPDEHTAMEWAAIDGRLSEADVAAERSRRAVGHETTDTSAMRAAGDAQLDAHDAMATPDDRLTPAVDEHRVGQADGGSHLARANSYAAQAFPRAQPDLPAAVATHQPPIAAAAKPAAVVGRAR
ncbi:MAG: hypothetical protein WA988_12975 [Candidatus Nanopelagicales bacterium]|jgi:hypothetical protein